MSSMKNSEVTIGKTWTVARKPVMCAKCKGPMAFQGGGLYKCTKCGYEEWDDFGKLKEYIRANGPIPAFQLSQATGVRLDVIKSYLQQGRLEIPEGSEEYIHCERCGCDIRFGRFCPKCAAELAGGIKQAIYMDVGEEPRNSGNRMRFLNKDHDKR